MAQKFDGLQYLASYPDLIEAFGADAAAGRQHYLQFGQHEGRRTDTFDEKQYLKNYLIIRVTHPAMMTLYGCGAVRAQA